MIITPDEAVTRSNLCRSWGSVKMPLPCNIDSKSIMTPSELELQDWLVIDNIHGRYILSMCWGRGRATNTPSLKSHKQQNAVTSKNGSEATKNGSFLGRISTRPSNFACKIVLDTRIVQLVMGGVFSEAPRRYSLCACAELTKWRHYLRH